MKIVMVTKLLPKTHYSRYLYYGLQNVAENFRIIFYTSKNEKIYGIQQVRQLWSSTLYPFQVFKKSLEDHPDIVHIQHEFNMFGPFYTILFLPLLLLLLRLTRAKTVVTIHAVVPLSSINRQFIEDLSASKMKMPSIAIKMVFILIYRPMLILTSAAIVHDHCFRVALISSYKINGEKVHVIPLGVDDRDINIEKTIIDKWSRKFADRKVILYFGYITPRKGLEYLLDAYAQITKQYQNYVLVLAGGILPYHTSYAYKIMRRIEKLNLLQHLVITGFITDEEIHALYELADLIVLPYTYSIASSLALSFAIQHKKSVIATNIGAFHEEIDNGKDGLLCPSRNSEALKEALIKIIGNPSLQEEFSRNLNKKISKRSWYNVGKKTYELYEILLSNTTNESV